MDTTSNGVPMGKMMALFLGLVILGNIVLAVIGYFLPDLDVPGSVGIVFQLIAAMAAGGVAAKATARRMSFGEKLTFAVASTALTFVMAIGIFWAVLAYFGVPFTLQNVTAMLTGDTVSDAEIMQILPWVGLFAVLVSLLVSFFGVGLGARNQLKQAERLATKGK